MTPTERATKELSFDLTGAGRTWPVLRYKPDNATHSISSGPNFFAHPEPLETLRGTTQGTEAAASWGNGARSQDDGHSGKLTPPDQSSKQ
jgi:hypothetical protein